MLIIAEERSESNSGQNDPTHLDIASLLRDHERMKSSLTFLQSQLERAERSRTPPSPAHNQPRGADQRNRRAPANRVQENQDNYSTGVSSINVYYSSFQGGRCTIQGGWGTIDRSSHHYGPGRGRQGWGKI